MGSPRAQAGRADRLDVVELARKNRGGRAERDASPRAPARASSGAGARDREATGRAAAAPARSATPPSSRRARPPSRRRASRAGVSGQKRSASQVTGSASAAKFVPQRGEKRVGRAAPSQVATSRRSSTAAIARCSAPWRRSVRPRSIQKPRASVAAIPTGVRHGPGRRKSRKGASSAARRNGLSRRPATPDRRNSGASDKPSRASPRASGTRCTHPGSVGIVPSRSEPSRPANAQWRSLTITTPSGRAIPPRRGRETAASARASVEARPRSTSPLLPQKRPPGRCRAAYLTFFGPSYQAPREKKPSSARTSTTIRMIHRMLTRASFGCLRNNVRGREVVTRATRGAARAPRARS